MKQTQVQLPLWRRARRRAYWLLLVALVGLADLVPLAWGRACCLGLARLAMKVRPQEMRRARKNLELAFPELSGTEAESLARQCSLALGRNLNDSLAAGKILKSGVMVERPPAGQEGRTLVQAVAELQAKDRGVLFLTGHIGCWELLGAWAAREFNKAKLGRLGVVTGTLHNPPVNDLVQRRRSELGLTVLPREAGLPPVLKHLRDQGLVAILLDQSTTARNLMVPFFGRPAPTAVGLAQLALKYGIPVVPLGLARCQSGQKETHEVRWLTPLEPEPVAGEISDAELLDFLGRCNGALEELIRRNPVEWVWFHERWN